MPNKPICQPPEDMRAADGWHGLRAESPQVIGNPFPARWGARAQGWWAEDVGLRGHNAEEAAAMGFRYFAPVTYSTSKE